MLDITVGELLVLMGVPSALTGFFFWLLKRKLDKSDKEQEKKEATRGAYELLLIKNTRAAIALGEATARAVQRIPDAHCNGDMKEALEYAAKVKHEQKDFLAEQGLHSLFDYD